MDRKIKAKFYATTAWRKMVIMIRDRDMVCVMCRKNNIATPIDCIDHIISIEKDWGLRLDPNNLQGLCRKHHQEKTTEESKQYNKFEVYNNKWNI